MSTESKGFCCGARSRKLTPVIPMPRVPKGLMKIHKEYGNVRKYSRMYNHIFPFSALGRTGGLHRLNGLANLVFHERTYQAVVRESIRRSAVGPQCGRRVRARRRQLLQSQ